MFSWVEAWFTEAQPIPLVLKDQLGARALDIFFWFEAWFTEAQLIPLVHKDRTICPDAELEE